MNNSAPVLEAAQRGNEHAFEELVSPWRRGLTGYCFRMLGSLADADDAVQETTVRAWKNLSRFEGRSQFRTWLYQIATRVCLDLIDQRKTRTWPTVVHGAAGPGAPTGPDALYEYVDPAPASFEENVALGPDVVIEQRESVALALLVALQTLPASQRAVLVLRDVMGLQATEVAELLDTSVPAVNSTLQRARASAEKVQANGVAPRRPSGAHEEELLSKYLRSWETSDASSLLAVLESDARMSMPPMAAWFEGAEAVAGFLGQFISSGAADAQRFRGMMTRAAGRPAIALYSRTAPGQPYLPNSLHLIEASGARVDHVRVWVLPALFARFGLPAELGKPL